jgi:hypothetical protein
MKRIKVKRLLYHSPNSGEIFYGGEEYDGNLTDDNILGSIHEVGKTVWYGDSLWAIRGEDLVYRITVEEFTQYTKSKFDLFLDAIRRI